MVKKISGSIVILAIACASVFNMGLNSQSKKVIDISLANNKALANGEEGTSVGTCYLQGGVDNYVNKIPCDSRTDANTIYPCLSSALH
ncbi:MAG: hypothetical protein LBG28_07625 [Tannerella sp.]|jgi:hypothetical protein|nr:hypothetical protein [Tannerella sp.]